MYNTLNKKPLYSFIFVSLLGITAFLLIADVSILNPSNTDWILQNDDSSWHYFVWQFFRQSPLLQFPLGANPRYGLDISSSIIYSDSIPLMAFIFKPISPLLPETFQYFGIWILLCFILQSFFAWKLMSVFTDSTPPPHSWHVSISFCPRSF